VPQVIEALTIKNKLGLHARPAALLVQTASKFAAVIELRANGIKVNGKSIMGVMMLAAAHGSEITVIADGEDATGAVAALRALIDSKFDEE
jgi:phosphocarrier protein